jgi:riboflavin kinase / FMN adenylyltransferase
MVQHFSSLNDVNIRNTFLTIGSFDGIHLGHQQLIHKLNKQAHLVGAKSVVLTFHPHPAVILRGRTGAFYLTTPSEKVEQLDELGTDIVITHPFTRELSQSTAREYVLYLMDHLGFLQLWVGYDFALGKGREGNLSYLKLLGEDLGYQVHIIDPVMINGAVVSSSHIRNLIMAGNISEANILLARLYQVAGVVVHGDGRGKHIGIPTANLETGDEKLIPGAGVYACQVKIQDRLFSAAVNVGTRPTFETNDRRSHVEAHILDYSGDLYTQRVRLDFIERLRGEERFESVDELIKQIYVDIDRTREIIARVNRS